LPPDASGDALVTVDDHESNKVQLTDWNLTFTQEGSTTIPGVGTSQGTMTFNVRFRGDVHEFRQEAGDEPMSLVLVPFTLEEADSSLSWNITGTALGQTSTSASSTKNLVPIDFTTPTWILNLPDTSWFWGEGYVNMTEKKLYLFLAGEGGDPGFLSGGGTFNIGSPTDCSYYLDSVTNRAYFVFDLDEQFNIAKGSCSDQIHCTINGVDKICTTDTRTWTFTTSSPPDPNAAI
jgi:hypothetical protein